MILYVIKRTLATIPIMLFVILIVFFALNITPGDPGRMMLGQNALQEDVNRLNHSLGVDRPFFVQYVDYIGKAVRGDFGKSYRTEEPVFEVLLSKFPITFTFTIISMFISLLIGIPIGVIAAIKQFSKFDMFFSVFSLILVSIPAFVVAILSILLFSLELGWLPSSGIGSWKNFVLPIASSALFHWIGSMRMSRATMIQTLRQDYITTAKAKGASKRRIIIKHALLNALRPMFVIFGMGLAISLGGSVITETVFGLPGIGAAILTAVSVKDAPMVMASTIFLALIYCFMMIFVDVLNVLVDPTLKKQFVK